VWGGVEKEGRVTDEREERIRRAGTNNLLHRCLSKLFTQRKTNILRSQRGVKKRALKE